MVAAMTPWSAEAELDGAVVRLSVQLTTDPGPARAFREFLSVELDEAHATVLFGQLGLALQALRERPASNVRPAALSAAAVDGLATLIGALPRRPENDR
jgi:hypothetical protein